MYKDKRSSNKKPLILTLDKNTDISLINALLDEVQTNKMVRTITAEDIFSVVTSFERASRNGHLTKTSREDLRLNIDLNAQGFPNAYKYTPYSTQFRLLYKRGTWRLESIYRGVCRGKTQTVMFLGISAKLKDEIAGAFFEREV